MTIHKEIFLIGIVGTCSSGKSTLKAGLEKHGFRARGIAQEHSFVKNMWERITNPDILIFLDVSYRVAQERRKLNWSIHEYEEQQYRLRDARLHADFYLDTNTLTPEEVLSDVLRFLKNAVPSSFFS